MHQVAFALLDSKTPTIAATACLDGTIATIYEALSYMVEEEVDFALMDGENGKAPDKSNFDVRRSISASCKQAGCNLNDALDSETDETLTLECGDLKEWAYALQMLQDEVLWDEDFDQASVPDMEPERASLIKKQKEDSG